MKKYIPYILLIGVSLGWWFHSKSLNKKIDTNLALHESNMVEMQTKLAASENELSKQRNTNTALMKVIRGNVKQDVKKVYVRQPYNIYNTDTVLKTDTCYLITESTRYGTILSLQDDCISTIVVVDENGEVIDHQSSVSVPQTISVSMKSKPNWFWRLQWGKKRWNIDVETNSSCKFEFNNTVKK